MNLEAHVDQLNAKRAEIDKYIHQEEHRPQPDTIRLMQLKKEKLRIKEEIERLVTKH